MKVGDAHGNRVCHRVECRLHPRNVDSPESRLVVAIYTAVAVATSATGPIFHGQLSKCMVHDCSEDLSLVLTYMGGPTGNGRTEVLVKGVLKEIAKSTLTLGTTFPALGYRLPAPETLRPQRGHQQCALPTVRMIQQLKAGH